MLEFVELNDQRDMLPMRGLIQVIRKLREQDYAMLLVEQTVQLALSVSDYAYGMSHGRIEIEGEARLVRAMESVRNAFLGV